MTHDEKLRAASGLLVRAAHAIDEARIPGHEQFAREVAEWIIAADPYAAAIARLERAIEHRGEASAEEYLAKPFEPSRI